MENCISRGFSSNMIAIQKFSYTICLLKRISGALMVQDTNVRQIFLALLFPWNQQETYYFPENLWVFDDFRESSKLIA